MSSEMMQYIDYLAKTRGLSKDDIIEAMKNSLRESAKKSVVAGYQNVEVEFDPAHGVFTCYAHLVVVENVMDPRVEISLPMARTQIPGAKVKDEIRFKIDPAKLGRISANNAQQYLTNALNELEKKHVLTHYQGLEGQLLTGTVTRSDRNGIYVTFEDAEGFLPHKECIPGEKIDANDTITVLLKSLNRDKGPCLQLTRTAPLFVQRLFEREVSEISDGTVVIKAIAREAGYRTKIAVTTGEEKVDPIGACVGKRGMRVRTIISELGGAEKVDIIKWDEDIRTYVANALKPAELAQVQVDEKKHTLNVKVTEEMFSLSIGKKGQNSRLAARLLGWSINIERYVPEATHELTMQEMIQQAVQNFVQQLGIDETLAQALVGNGYHSLDGLREATPDDLLAIEGMTPELAAKIAEAAKAN